MIALLMSSLPREPGSWAVWEFQSWGPWLTMRLFHAALYLLGAFLLDRLFRLILKRVRTSAPAADARTKSEIERRVATVTTILRRVGGTVIYLTAGLMILNDFSVQIGPLLAGLGIAGVALGFGSQYLVRDIISGLFIVLEDQFRVGDVVTIGTFTGLVEHMFLRTTQVRAVNGDLHIVPNGQITGVTNLTRQWSRSVLDVGVSYKANLDEVFDALAEVGHQAAEDATVGPAFIEEPEVVGVMGLGDSSITVRLQGKVEPLRQWEVERFLRKKVKEVFDARGIEIPFPQRTLGLDASAAEALAGRKGKKT
jgi:small conductance mechanosensitive channel